MPTFRLAGGVGSAGPTAASEKGGTEVPPSNETCCSGQKGSEAARWAQRPSIQRVWAVLALWHSDSELVKPRAKNGMTPPTSYSFLKESRLVSHFLLQSPALRPILRLSK